MLKNRDLPAQPTTACIDRKTNSIVEQQTGNDEYIFTGLTKREEFAKAALQGLLVNAERNGLTFHTCASEAVRQADMLLAELDK